MTVYSIRYRYVVLLFWATFALATNPVWHAISHCDLDCHEEDTEAVSFIEWGEHDLCPYCEAVSQFADTAPKKASFVLVDLHEEVERVLILYTDLRYHLSIRLRAPPLLV